MGIAYNTSIVRDGLVLHLDAANVKSYPGSGTVWKDLSGNGNNGTLVNGVGYNSDNKGAMVFDGSNDNITTNYTPVSGTSPRTISLCFFANGAQNRNLLGYGSASEGQMWDILLYNGTVGIHLYASTNEAGIAYSPYRWQHVTFTYNSGTIQSYMDGEYKNSYYSPSINTGTAYNLNIGRGVFGSYYWFNGKISLIQIYNRALLPAEIKRNFEATRGRYGI